jgi:hypothetical protein
VLVSNRAEYPVEVRLSYIRRNGTSRITTLTLAGRSRTTIDPSQDREVAGEDVALSIQAVSSSDQRYILAEQAVYFNRSAAMLWQSGRSSEAIELSARRFFAEGFTGGPLRFREEYAVVNPHPFRIRVQMQLMFNDSQTNRDIWIDAQSVVKFATNGWIPDGAPHGAVLSGFDPEGKRVGIAAERTMTWNDGGESHSTSGAPEPSDEWYFAEGAKGGPFSTYFTVINPGADQACLQVSYMGEEGAPFREYPCLAAYTRQTFEIPSAAPGGGYAVKIESLNGVPVVAERAMYWNVGKVFWEGGTAVTGSSQAADHWLLTEGSTGAFFRSYILLANPSSATASVKVKYLLPDGGERVTAMRIPAERRLTISVNEVPGVTATAYSAEIISENNVPIVAERVMYWDSRWYGGHGSMGSIVR